MSAQCRTLIPEAFHIPAVLTVLSLLIVTLVTDKFKTSLVFLLAISALVALGLLDLQVFVGGLSNLSILTIFLLIVITQGINESFNLAGLFSSLFRGVRSAPGFLFRMGLGVAGFSAFMNNTPVVAVMMPHVYQWGRSNQVNPSKLLMPLSFAAILGGVITLIGTSTNLVLNGLLEDSGQHGLGFGDFLFPGLAVALVCLLVMVWLAPKLLRNRQDLLDQATENKREYLVETLLKPDSEMVGKSVEDAGLRNLEGSFLTEIIRGDRVIAPVSPEQFLMANDRLLFAGDTAAIMEMVKARKGLELSKTNKFNLVDNTRVLETVIAQNASIDRQNVKQIGFREKFDAAIIGIHRRGERLSGKIGAIELRTGDLLLLVAGREFEERNRRQNDLILINALPESKALPAGHKAIFWLGLLTLLLFSALGTLRFFEALMGIAMLQVFLGMLTVEKVKRSLSLDLLIILISALSLGEVLISSGTAQWMSERIFFGAAHWAPLGLLASVFGFTFLLTSFVTNVAAISIVFPVVFSLAPQTALPAEALYLTAAFGASCCFITPYAYQTNLMVMELGDYRFTDFLRLGWIVSLFYALTYLIYAYFAFLK